MTIPICSQPFLLFISFIPFAHVLQLPRTREDGYAFAYRLYHKPRYDRFLTLASPLLFHNFGNLWNFDKIWPLLSWHGKLSHRYAREITRWYAVNGYKWQKASTNYNLSRSSGSKLTALPLLRLDLVLVEELKGGKKSKRDVTFLASSLPRSIALFPLYNQNSACINWQNAHELVICKSNLLSLKTHDNQHIHEICFGFTFLWTSRHPKYVYCKT